MLDDLITQMRTDGSDATGVVADVNIEKDVERLVNTTVATYGQIDAVFNNPGTEGGFSPITEQTNEIYNTIFNADVRGLFWSMKYEAKAMLTRGHGSIINNASMGGGGQRLGR